MEARPQPGGDAKLPQFLRACAFEVDGVLPRAKLSVALLTMFFPSRTDPSAAPEGCESVMVLLPVANQQEMATSKDSNLEYDELVTAGRQAVLRALSEAEGITAEALRASITREVVIDPADWAER